MRARLRIEKLRNAIKKLGIEVDVVLLTKRENTVYFSGGATQLECASILIPLDGDPVAITLWLDVEYLKSVSGLENIHGYRFPQENLGREIVRALREVFRFKGKKLLCRLILN